MTELSNTRNLSVEILNQLISAYNDMRLTCLIQARLLTAPQLKFNLIEIAWQCDATIASLEVIVEQLNGIVATDNATPPFAGV